MVLYEKWFLMAQVDRKICGPLFLHELEHIIFLSFLSNSGNVWLNVWPPRLIGLWVYPFLGLQVIRIFQHSILISLQVFKVFIVSVVFLI